MWPFKTASPRAVEKSHVYLLDGGQVRAIQTDDDILSLLGVGTGSDGLPIGERTRAMSYSASAACLRVISNLVASVPVHCYRRTSDDGRERLRGHPVELLMNDRSAPWMPSHKFIRFMTLEMMFSGEAMAKVIRVRKEPRELNILTGISVEYDQFTGEPRYRVNRKNGGDEVLSWRDVFHVSSPTGGAPVKQAANAILLGLLLEKSAINLFKNGGRPSGILSFKAKVDPATAEKVRTEWEADIAANPGKIVPLGGDCTYTPIDFKSTDTEHNVNRQTQIKEVSRFFGLMPVMMGELEDATLNNSEALFRQTLITCIDPYLDEYRGAIELTLLTDEERKAGIYVEHATGDLTSADLKATAEALDKMVGGPVMTANEGRARQNLPKVEGGDKLYPPRGSAKATEPAA